MILRQTFVERVRAIRRRIASKNAMVTDIASVQFEAGRKCSIQKPDCSLSEMRRMDSSWMSKQAVVSSKA